MTFDPVLLRDHKSQGVSAMPTTSPAILLGLCSEADWY